MSLNKIDLEIVLSAWVFLLHLVSWQGWHPCGVTAAFHRSVNHLKAP